MGDGDSGEGSPQKSWLERVAAAFSSEPASRDDLLDVIAAAGERGLVDQDAISIIHGALHVGEMQVRDVMIPRSQVVFIDTEQTPARILETAVTSGHSRFPVVSGDGLDDVRGILHAKDLLALDREREFDLRDLIRPATVVPESKRLNVLLSDFRANRNHMAVVVDEYGSVAGIVTIEDVLEQIVGDIEDEHDVSGEHFIKQLADNTWTVKAMTPVEEFNAHFDTDFSEDEFDTIGGIVMNRFGRMPRRDEAIDIDGFFFRVLNADGRRIQLLHLTDTRATAQPAHG